MISNSLVPRKPPGIRCVLTLVEALLVPLISYGFPIWEPENSRKNALDQLIARPLRRCLSLPQKSTHAFSVIVECGLLNIDSLYAIAAVRLGAAVFKLEANDPVKALLFDHRNPVTATIRRFQRQLDVSIDNSRQMRQLRQTVDQHQLEQWALADSGSKSLKGVKLKPGASQYLLRDSRHVCSLRARLRFDRSSLNSSLADRKLLPSPHCPACHCPETNEHCLLSCPMFSAERKACNAELQPIGLNLELLSALGCTELLPTNSVTTVLQATGRFLLAIDASRKL
jgi:hypothetical protein